MQRHAKPPAGTRGDTVMAARDAHLAATPGDVVITYGAAHLRPFLRLSPALSVVLTRNLPFA